MIKFVCPLIAVTDINRSKLFYTQVWRLRHRSIKILLRCTAQIFAIAGNVRRNEFSQEKCCSKKQNKAKKKFL